ncbi:MAG: non-canonical purine NTP diphosphatase [Bacteroidota bacterium]
MQLKDQLIFATSNPNKIREANEILGDFMHIVSNKDIGCHEDIPETADTFEGNALQKARYLSDHYKVNCFSEDTGLEITALDGAPGVITARYSGPERDANANMDLVLRQLEGKADRSAQFRTAIALIIDGEENVFEGIVKGRIAFAKSGMGGFGYDPIFIPDGYDQTFAELDKDIKNLISHRARAMDKLRNYLQTRQILS